MTVRVALTDQIAALETAIAAIGGILAERDFYIRYPHMIDFEIDNLRAVARTLAWFQTHEQTIRDAISSARSLDAAQQVP